MGMQAHAVNPRPVTRPAAHVSPREGSVTFDWIATALGAWLLGGIFADGWAHNHIHVESFFTPWHAVLYSGFFANAIFMFATVLRARRGGLGWREAVPAGYLPSAVGIVVFLVSGLGDMAWHLVFGIEISVSAGFSPPHLGIMTATGLIVTGPFLAAWRRAEIPDRWAGWLPTLFSITLGISLMTFVTQYANPLVVISASVRPLHFHDQALGAIGILLQTAIWMGWLLIAIRRWIIPTGSITLILTINAIAMSFMRSHFFLVPSVVAAGIVIDALLWTLRPAASRPTQFHLFAFLPPPVYYLLYFGVVWLREGITWPIPLWTGSAFMAGIVAVLLSYLILPAPYPEAETL